MNSGALRAVIPYGLSFLGLPGNVIIVVVAILASLGNEG